MRPKILAICALSPARYRFGLCWSYHIRFDTMHQQNYEFQLQSSPESKPNFIATELRFCARHEPLICMTTMLGAVAAESICYDNNNNAKTSSCPLKITKTKYNNLHTHTHFASDNANRSIHTLFFEFVGCLFRCCLFNIFV